MIQERVTIDIKPEVQRIFEEHHDEVVEAMVLASKNGIPIASFLNKPEKNESFGALTATIFGASDVIFTSFDKTTPDMVEIVSDDTILLLKGIGKSAVLAIMGVSSEKSLLRSIMDSVSAKIEESISFN